MIQRVPGCQLFARHYLVAEPDALLEMIVNFFDAIEIHSGIRYWTPANDVRQSLLQAAGVVSRMVTRGQLDQFIILAAGSDIDRELLGVWCQQVYEYLCNSSEINATE